MHHADTDVRRGDAGHCQRTEAAAHQVGQRHRLGVEHFVLAHERTLMRAAAVLRAGIQAPVQRLEVRVVVGQLHALDRHESALLRDFRNAGGGRTRHVTGGGPGFARTGQACQAGNGVGDRRRQFRLERDVCVVFGVAGAAEVADQAICGKPDFVGTFALDAVIAGVSGRDQHAGFTPSSARRRLPAQRRQQRHCAVHFHQLGAHMRVVEGVLEARVLGHFETRRQQLLVLRTCLRRVLDRHKGLKQTHVTRQHKHTAAIGPVLRAALGLLAKFLRLHRQRQGQPNRCAECKQCEGQ